MGKNIRGEIAVNTIFYILMVVFMVGIILFGMQKLFFTQNIISEQERLEIQKDLIDALEYCEDPLNAGNIKYIEFRSKMFNSICILGDDFGSSPSPCDDLEDVDSLYDNGDNIVLLKTGFYKNSDNVYVMSDVLIIDSFSVDVDVAETFGFLDKENTGVVKLDIKCE